VFHAWPVPPSHGAHQCTHTLDTFGYLWIPLEHVCRPHFWTEPRNSLVRRRRVFTISCVAKLSLFWCFCDYRYFMTSPMLFSCSFMLKFLDVFDAVHLFKTYRPSLPTVPTCWNRSLSAHPFLKWFWSPVLCPRLIAAAGNCAFGLVASQFHLCIGLSGPECSRIFDNYWCITMYNW